MVKATLLFFLITLLPLLGHTQESEKKTSRFGSNIFLPSLELGYIANNGSILSGGMMTKTSLEYRLRNNNDIFLRLNYDAVNANYKLPQSGFTNVLEGKVSFSDFLGGLGYRFGDKSVRSFVLAQAGGRTYNFPIVEQEANSLMVKSAAHGIFLTRLTLGAEYYFDEKSAFTLEVVQNSVWHKRHFWQENTGSWGVVLGFITSLF